MSPSLPEKFLAQFLALFALAFLLSCGGGSNSITPPGPTLQSMTVSPQNASVAAGLRQQFTATGIYSDGSSRALSAVKWSMSDTTVATVDSAGMVTTLKPGTVMVSASSGAVSNTAPLNVGPPIAISLTIVPATSSVKIGAIAPTTLSAILTYSDHSTTDVSATARWSVSNPFTAGVDNSGSVTALRTGYANIQAVSGTFTATSAFVVTAQPRYLYFLDNAGRLASKATIDSASGQLRMAGYIQTAANNYAVFPCPTSDPSNKYVYVGASVNNGGLSGEVQTYHLDPVSGSLTPLPGSPFPQASPIECMDFEPSGKFAYSSSGGNGSTVLLTYSADASTGALTLLNTASMSGIPTRPAIDPIGKYLYLAAFSSGFTAATALGYSIDPSTGALSPVPGTPFTLSNISGTFSFHPTGDLLYMANTNGQSIDSYAVDRSSGKLSALGSLTTCINPTTLRFSPDGKFAYSACSMDSAHHPASASVESFAVGLNGSLTHLGSTPSADGPLDLTMDPSGQFLYLDNISPYIYAFHIGSDGIATFVRRSGTPPNPGAALLAVGGADPVQYTPKAAYITSTADDTFSTYAVHSDGTLAAPQSVPTGTAFSSLSLWPWGADIAMASAVPIPNLLSFPLSSTTGLPGAGFSFGDATIAGGVALDPSGQFGFATDSVQGVIYTYGKAGSSWGLFTYLGTTTVTTFNAGAGAGPIVIDPSGLLVYVANQVDNSISAYQYWGTSAELFESKAQFVQPYIDGSPFSVGVKPISLAIDPNEAFLYVLCGDGTLRAFAIDYFSGGHIAQVASVSLVGQPSGLAVEPTGQFVYTSDSTGVKAFSVNAQSGAFTTIALSPAITLTNITGIYAEPAGQYLYVTTGGQNVSGAVFGYSIRATGNLGAISTQPLATPALPSSMAFGDDIR